MLASLLLAAIAYVSPVHYPIELAGNFGDRTISMPASTSRPTA